MLISSFTLQNGTLITPLLLFYLQLGLVWTKIHRFVEYTPKKCFNRFVQEPVDARRKGDENPNSSVATETLKLLANNSYGYQIMDRSRHTVMKYLTDKKPMRPITVNSSKAISYEQISVWSWIRQSSDWTRRANHCRVLHSSIRKVATVGAVLQLLHQILWCKQVRRVWNGHRFAVTYSCRERTRRLYKTWNESWMAEVAIKWLCR